MNQEILFSLMYLILLATLILMAWRRGYKKQVKIILLALVATAERNWGSGTGKIKFSEVYSQLPMWATVLFTEKQIYRWVDEILDELKNYIELIPEGKVIKAL